MSKRIDVEAELERAFAELDAQIPDGYFETFSSKVLASLETEVSMQARRPDVLTPEPGPTPPPPKDEHSGLHEIKALAQTARNRIRRRTSESDVEAMLSTSSSALSAVVLPEPGSETTPPEPIAARPSVSGLPAAPRSTPAWLWAAGGTAVVAAAVAAALFVFARGGADVDTSGEQAVAAADQPAPPAASAPAEPAPPPAPEPTVAALSPDTETDSDTEPEPESEPELDSERQEQADSPRATARQGRQDRAQVRKERREREAQKREARKAKESAPVEAKAAGGAAKAESSEATGDLAQLLDQVAGPESAKKPKQAPAEEKVDKKRLGSGDVRAAMSGITGAVKSCQKKTGFFGRVKVKFTVSPSGVVGRVKASGANAAVHSCVASAVKRARFPTFKPPAMSFRYSFLLSD